MQRGLNQQKLAVDSGHWLLYRHDPRLVKEGKNPLKLDSKAPSISLKDYIYNETRYKMLTKIMPERAEKLLKKAEEAVIKRYEQYNQLASVPVNKQ